MTMRVVMPDCDPVVMDALHDSGLLARLERTYSFDAHMGVPRDAAEWLGVIGDADAVLLGANLADVVLERAPKVRFVSFTGLGVANFVNLPLARQRGIRVANTPGYGNASVSEHALALLLAVARRIPEGDRTVRRHEWLLQPGIQLAGKTAGVIGYGGIGKATARLLAGLGMDVVVWARTPPDPTPEGLRFVPLDSIFEAVDVLSLHLTLNDETRGIISAARLARLRPGAIVINTARAELVDGASFEARLVDGSLSAGLDVFSREPLQQDSTLRKLPNVVMSPHQGYNTAEALHELLRMSVDNIDGFFAGRMFFEV